MKTPCSPETRLRAARARRARFYYLLTCHEPQMRYRPSSCDFDEALDFAAGEPLSVDELLRACRNRE